VPEIEVVQACPYDIPDLGRRLRLLANDDGRIWSQKVLPAPLIVYEPFVAAIGVRDGSTRGALVAVWDQGGSRG
jgi:hypothetical protein